MVDTAPVVLSKCQPRLLAVEHLIGQKLKPSKQGTAGFSVFSVLLSN